MKNTIELPVDVESQSASQLVKRTTRGGVPAVTNDDEYESATLAHKEARMVLREVEAKEKKVTKKINEALQEVRGLFRPFKDELKEFISSVAKVLDGYEVAKEAERRRIEEELNKKVEKERKKEERAAERKAKKLEEQGDTIEAAEVRASVPTKSRTVLTGEAVPKVAGVARAKTWKARWRNIANQKQILNKAISEWNAKHPEEPLMRAEFWKEDDVARNSWAKRTKGQLVEPGIETYDATVRR